MTTRTSPLTRPVLAAVTMLLVAASAHTQTVDLHVETSDGSGLSGYRWLLQEDVTWDVEPGVADPEPLSLSFHRSYLPPVAKGDGVGTTTLTVDPSRRYVVSVLPDDSGYTLGGTTIAAGQTDVTVVVDPVPLEAAQITIFVFHDRYPINNAPDYPQEEGLAGFSIELEDSTLGEQLSYDVFGNPLGTTYDAAGEVVTLGDGVILTDANGRAVIRNLAPGKYGVSAKPPAGQQWMQTTTIEGGPKIDVWVGPGEAPLVVEFGPPLPHAFFGFVQPFDALPEPEDAAGTLTGRITNIHLSRPPFSVFYSSEPVEHTVPRIALNDIGAGVGQGLYCAEAQADGTFSIADVPPGTYQLVVFDEFLDFIISFSTVTVPPEGGLVDLGDVPVFQWFSRVEATVFYDTDEDGWMDPGEVGMAEQATNLRFRDGSVYQAFPTDVTGYVPYDQVFPWFHWLVFEVDYARFRSTGVTVFVDDGGEVDPSDPFSSGGDLNPQPQPEQDGAPYRTEVGDSPGAVLTEAFQGFLGQTQVMHWGKKDHAPGSNGGISGIVYYATTRAEDDPAYAAAEPWEPGVPRVQVNLYADADGDKVIDDLDGDGGPTLADVDNWPFGFHDGALPGPEDVDTDGDLQFDPGDAVAITTTDSWDDSLPTGCVGDPTDPLFLGGTCYDGLRNWNQVRPGVFDGGYLFEGMVPNGLANGGAEVSPLPSGTWYIVEAATPRSALGPTYEVVKEEDRNVDFGDSYVPTYEALPPECVGDPHVVPAELSLFPGVPAPFAGQVRPLADRKRLFLTDGQNGAVDFFLFTEVPVAAQVVGTCLNDLGNEGVVNNPQFGEKFAPPYLPVSVRDWTGRELARTYTDANGKYNLPLPSTYTVNVPSPSGVAPNMLYVTMNDPGPVQDPAGGPGDVVIDPFYDAQFTQTRLKFNFLPGKTTILDTPVLPVAAHAGQDQFPLDCEFVDETPKVAAVSGAQGGPWVAGPGESITILSEGPTTVLNPLYDGPGGTQPATIVRDFGFGDVPGAVGIGKVPLVNVQWTDDVITGVVPAGATTGQLNIRRADGKGTITSVTVHVAPQGQVHTVSPGAFGTTPIQDAVDAAAPGDLVVIEPGTYFEQVVLWKPLHLQGSGSSTIINGVFAANTLEDWRAKVQELVDDGSVDLLPGQELGSGVVVEPTLLGAEEGAGLIVLAKDAPPPVGFGKVGGLPNASVDGLQIVGAAGRGGGLVVNGYARDLVVGNCRITGNQGLFNGGIRSGHPYIAQADGTSAYVPCENTGLRIHHCHIDRNGNTAGAVGAGGGISLYTGTDRYRVDHNFVCGNFADSDGGGIAHQGLSDGGRVTDNRIVFNESFAQGLQVSGGGLLVSGAPPLVAGDLTDGSGSVLVDANLILGNMAGAGDGGGVRLQLVNGTDLANAAPGSQQPDAGGLSGRGGSGSPPGAPKPLSPPSQLPVGDFPGMEAAEAFPGWHRVVLTNNIVANNIAGLAGGGISLQDAVLTFIAHNTVVNNDSTATAGEAFPPGGFGQQSEPQPAGIVSRAHTSALQAVLTADPALEPWADFSDPGLVNNVVWHNRSFTFLADATVFPPTYGLLPDVGAGQPPVYDDLAVLGTVDPAKLSPRSCLLTDATGYASSNISADPEFVGGYVNVDNGQTLLGLDIQGVQTAVAFDEGGNFIDVRFGPLFLADPTTGAQLGNYHLSAGSPAVGAGDDAAVALLRALERDIDRQPRTTDIDIGADERP